MNSFDSHDRLRRLGRALLCGVMVVAVISCTGPKEVNGEGFAGGDGLDSRADFLNDVTKRLDQIRAAMDQISVGVGTSDLYPTDAECSATANPFCEALALLDSPAQKLRVADELVAAARAGIVRPHARIER